MSHILYDLYKNEEFYDFYNKKHKAFFQQLETKFRARCYVVIYSRYFPIIISKVFVGDYNSFIKSNFERSELRNKGRAPVFTNLNQEIMKYLQLNCFKECLYEEQVYILAVDLNENSVKKNIVNKIFHKYIISAIEGKIFKVGCDCNKDISGDIILNEENRPQYGVCQ